MEPALRRLVKAITVLNLKDEGTWGLGLGTWGLGTSDIQGSWRRLVPRSLKEGDLGHMELGGAWRQDSWMSRFRPCTFFPPPHSSPAPGDHQATASRLAQEGASRPPFTSCHTASDSARPP